MRRHIFELAIAKVTVERVAHGLWALTSWRLASVQQKDIEQSVLIEIEKRDSATFGFNQICVGRLAVEPLPVNSGLLGDVTEDVSIRASVVFICEHGPRWLPGWGGRLLVESRQGHKNWDHKDGANPPPVPRLYACIRDRQATTGIQSGFFPCRLSKTASSLAPSSPRPRRRYARDSAKCVLASVGLSLAVVRSSASASLVLPFCSHRFPIW